MNAAKFICLSFAVTSAAFQSEETLKVYPNLTHTSCLDFYNYIWTWLDKNFRTN
jgi:hypothetical protein